MAFTRESNAWRFIQSILIMALILWPFYYVLRLHSEHWDFPLAVIETAQVVFVPVGWLFAVLCESITYCLQTQHPGLAGLSVLYITTVVIYGYGLSLIWGWAVVPQVSKKRRLQRDYIEHDDIF